MNTSRPAPCETRQTEDLVCHQGVDLGHELGAHLRVLCWSDSLRHTGAVGSTAWILEPSATGLCKPDLHVFAKLFEDCLKRGLEVQAFSGREIGGHDDVLDFLVGHFVDVDLTRQPAS